MSKIKSVSQFEDGIWGTETPIGADASNVDVEMSDSSTKDLQTVLGDIPSAAAPIQSQINTKVTASGGNIGNTTVSSGIQNFDSSSSETSTELLDTSVRVTNATEVTSSMWTKFNRFRKRVDNKFKDVFLSSVEDVASPSDYKTYSQSALNDYFANVVGYASASDLPDATSTIAQQLSTLNNKTSWLGQQSYQIYQKLGNQGTPVISTMIHIVKTGSYPVNSSGLVNLHDYFNVPTSNCSNLVCFCQSSLYYVGGIGVWNNMYYAIVCNYSDGKHTANTPTLIFLCSWDQAGSLS